MRKYWIPGFFEFIFLHLVKSTDLNVDRDARLCVLVPAAGRRQVATGTKTCRTQQEHDNIFSVSSAARLLSAPWHSLVAWCESLGPSRTVTPLLIFFRCLHMEQVIYGMSSLRELSVNSPPLLLNTPSAGRWRALTSCSRPSPPGDEIKK